MFEAIQKNTKKIDVFRKSTLSGCHSQKMTTARGETVRLMAEVDGVIESAGGWPVK